MYTHLESDGLPNEDLEKSLEMAQSWLGDSRA